MAWKKTLVLSTLLTSLAVLLCLPPPSYAQDYAFSLDQQVVDVWINEDGSTALEYTFAFTCDAGAHPIDVVDVGLPNADYALGDVRADAAGQPISFIEQSEYVEHGVAVWLGPGTINPGQSGHGPRGRGSGGQHGVRGQ